MYGEARMQDISVREKAGDSPGLIVNTTLYNHGCRFAVTALPVRRTNTISSPIWSARSSGRSRPPSQASRPASTRRGLCALRLFAPGRRPASRRWRSR
jgi:hypothetical protein